MNATTKVSQARHAENLEQVRERFKRWRETRVRGEHIPAVLWAAAADMAAEHGLNLVAQELRIDYNGLKKRLGQAGGALQASKGGTQFVELAFAPSSPFSAQSLCECAIELQNARGVKMRVELNGNGLAGLVDVCSAFWSAV